MAYGAMNSIAVEFEEDGYQVITSRYYVRQAKPNEVVQENLL